uniref:DNA replication licensing factor MCM4 n=1 Tax=Globodera rostochiensis TaxID=31243 RepID=A0A914IAH7_GLORO
MSRTPSAAGDGGASERRSPTPLVPLNEFERDALSASQQDRGSEYGGLDYPASESGFSGISSSTVATGHHGGRAGGGRRKRADMTMTPAHQRTMAVDANDDKLRNEIADIGPGEPDTIDQRVYIWGTRVCVAEVQAKFKQFITTFVAEQLDDDENAMEMDGGRIMAIDQNTPIYMEKLRGIYASEMAILDVNLSHVRQFNDRLYKIIVAYPDEVMSYLDVTLEEIFMNTYNKRLPFPIEMRPFNAEQTKNMRDLNPLDINQLVTTQGMVTRISPLIPQMVEGYFQCAFCNHPELRKVDMGVVEEPINCTNCNNQGCFQLIHNRSTFMDKQVIKLQEIPGDMPAGQTQHTVTLYVHGALVESVHPGDRITVTGIYRASPVRLNPVQQAVHSIFRTSMDVIHFRKMCQDRLHDVGDGTFLTEERVEKIKALSRCDDVIERLIKAIAPTIFGHEEIKRGILCLLFGGTRKSYTTESNRVRMRSDVNILLCGDPGTAKSQLLQYVYQLVPRSQYTSGKGSSAVGLSASITRDSDSKSVVLQTGALVLADNGVCCIDEFDKMNDGTRSILHEVMEQQTLSIAKAGIICQLNARTSVLAAANPIDSKWNKRKNIIKNDEEYDRRLARHLVNFYLESDGEVDKQQRVDMEFLRDYIAYAKANVRPELGDETVQLLIDKYQFMRQQGQQAGMISAYPRQLESLIRLAEAFAKMRLSQTVTEADVEMAYSLHREALRQSATDPDTGLIAVDIIATGYSEKHKHLVGAAVEQIRQEVEHRIGTFSLLRLFKELRIGNKLLDRECFEDAMKQLQRERFILRNGDKLRVLATKAT